MFSRIVGKPVLVPARFLDEQVLGLPKSARTAGHECRGHPSRAAFLARPRRSALALPCIRTSGTRPDGHLVCSQSTLGPDSYRNADDPPKSGACENLKNSACVLYRQLIGRCERPYDQLADRKIKSSLFHELNSL